MKMGLVVFGFSKKSYDWFIVGGELAGVEVLLNITIIHGWKKMRDIC